MVTTCIFHLPSNILTHICNWKFKLSAHATSMSAFNKNNFFSYTWKIKHVIFKKITWWQSRNLCAYVCKTSMFYTHSQCRNRRLKSENVVKCNWRCIPHPLLHRLFCALNQKQANRDRIIDMHVRPLILNNRCLST